MAVTDDERREVARRLREYVDLPDDWWADTYSGFYVEKCAFGDVERHRESELFVRLADLIEPSCDRDALLALAEDVTEAAAMTTAVDASKSAELLADMLLDIARRIREALGVEP